MPSYTSRSQINPFLKIKQISTTLQKEKTPDTHTEMKNEQLHSQKSQTHPDKVYINTKQILAN